MLILLFIILLIVFIWSGLNDYEVINFGAGAILIFETIALIIVLIMVFMVKR